MTQAQTNRPKRHTGTRHISTYKRTHTGIDTGIDKVTDADIETHT